MFDSYEEFDAIRRQAQARAYTRGATHEEAEDLVSEVIVYLVERGTPVESMLPYLCRSVDRRLASLRKEKQRRKEAETQHFLGHDADLVLMPIAPKKSLNSDGRPRRGGVDEVPCPYCGACFKPYLISRNPERRQQTCGGPSCSSRLLAERAQAREQRRKQKEAA